MKNTSRKVAFLILAAGEASRMGATKQLLTYAGKPLIRHIADNALLANCTDSFVVLGANQSPISECLQSSNLTIISNPNWKKGIGESISTGVQYISQLEVHYDAILIALADQPLIPLSHYNALISQYQNATDTIVATKSRTIIGVPAVFDSIHFSALIALEKHKGAKSIILSQMENVGFVNLDKGYIDIDTPEDYQSLLGLK